MAIWEAPQKCSPCASRAFPAGNGEGLNLDFDGIVAGCDIERQKNKRRKREYLRSLTILRISHHKFAKASNSLYCITVSNMHQIRK
jgi:hypothetical protein